MSVERETRHINGPSVLPRSLDLTGLPGPVANELRKLVATLRDNLGQTSSPSAPFEHEPPEEWARRLQARVDSYPVRHITIQDSRESLATGRGE